VIPDVFLALNVLKVFDPAVGQDGAKGRRWWIQGGRKQFVGVLSLGKSQGCSLIRIGSIESVPPVHKPVPKRLCDVPR
jgi:hypothetical protein